MNRRVMDPSVADLQSWPGTTTVGVAPAIAQIVIRREMALRRYVAGVPHKVIESETGIGRREVSRLWRRCTAIHLDGRIWGFRACCYYSHTRSYERSAPSSADDKVMRAGFSGLLGKLFGRFPCIAEKLLENAREYGRGANEPILRHAALHSDFLRLVKEAGVKGNEYPFSCVTQGERSLARWIKRELAHRDLRRFVNVTFGQAAADRVGFVDEPARIGSRDLPYERCEFDGHRIDVIATIEIPDPTGREPLLLPVERIWLLVVVDVASRAILGYHVSLERNYSSEDVLICLQNCVIPAPKRELTCPGLTYPEAAGFPGEQIPELAYALFGTLALDNAKANCASWVWERVQSCIGCTLNLGPVHEPESRRYIERFFRTVSEAVFQRLPSTTGCEPRDPKRRTPDATAVSSRIRLEEILDLVEVKLASYNATTTEGLHGRSPLEYLRFALQRNSFLPRSVPLESRTAFTLTLLKSSASVRGRLDAGERPYVRYLGVRYYSAELSSSANMIGCRVAIEANSRDLRRIKVFLPNGQEFGFLTAAQQWAGMVHDLRTRRAILKCIREGKLRRRNMPDVVAEYIEYKTQEAKDRRRARNEVAHVKKLQLRSNVEQRPKDTRVGDSSSIVIRPAAPEIALPALATNY